MIKKFRKNHPIIFVLLALIICWVVGLKAIGFVFKPTIGQLLSQLDMSNIMADGVGTIIADGFVIIIAIIIFLISGRLSVITKKGAGFFQGLKVGAVPLVIYCIVIAMFVCVFATADESTLAQGTDLKIHPAFTTASVVSIISFLFVGVAEEFTLRGIIAETLLEHFGTKRAGVWKAAFLSALLFGLTHLLNLESLNGMFVFQQIFSALGAGVLLAAIYFRCGNIWVVALLHALNDIMASTAVWYGGVDMADVASTVAGINPFPFVLAIVDILLAAFLLRKKKIGQVKDSWPEIENWQNEDNDENKNALVEQGAK